jgi:hypothetical protein
MDDSLRFMLMQVIHSSVTIHKGTQVKFSYFITTKHSSQQSLSHSIQIMCGKPCNIKS